MTDQIRNFAWCFHCERAFEIPGTSDDDLPDDCPLESCDGSYIDFWLWKAFRELKPNYPQVPTHGAEYRLYPVEVAP